MFSIVLETISFLHLVDIKSLDVQFTSSIAVEDQYAVGRFNKILLMSFGFSGLPGYISSIIVKNDEIHCTLTVF
jgi:hypothetical protein